MVLRKRERGDQRDNAISSNNPEKEHVLVNKKWK
jgi:hypothetical protein